MSEARIPYSHDELFGERRMTLTIRTGDGEGNGPQIETDAIG